VTDATSAAGSGDGGSGAVVVRLPGPLRDLVGGRRELSVSPPPATVDELLDALSIEHPVLVRRIRDETGSVRQFVNVYVGDDDIRHGAGLATPLAPGTVVHFLPSVAGG
jgi:molybdopterin converting factor small subunit